MENDYISREAAIRAHCDGCVDDGYCGKLDGRYACEDVPQIMAIPAADVVPAPRWIPVTERFPPLDKEVLVFAIGLPEWGFEGKTATAIAYRFIYRFWSSGKEYEQWSTPWEHFHMDYKITHWMPLPEPPKEGGS